MSALSPADRASRVVQDFSGQTFSNAADAEVYLQRRITDAIRSQREECAKLCESLVDAAENDERTRALRIAAETIRYIPL